MNHPRKVLIGAVFTLMATLALGQRLQTVTVIANPTCGCCHGWVGHLQAKGFKVDAFGATNSQLNATKDRYGVPPNLRACHTGLVGDYVIEGHVPGEVISRLLREKPAIVGLAVPGMPVGSPGMEGPNPQPYTVYSFDGEGNVEVYAQIDPLKTGP